MLLYRFVRGELYCSQVMRSFRKPTVDHFHKTLDSVWDCHIPLIDRLAKKSETYLLVTGDASVRGRNGAYFAPVSDFNHYYTNFRGQN